jgi:hypothetical protein
MRLIQPGTGARRPVLLTFFCGVAIKKFAAALGPRPAIFAVAGKSERVTREQLEAELAKLSATIDEVAVAGYSAGALYGVRDSIATVRPEVVFAFDGTHGHGLIWNALAARALRGEVLFVASHTYLLYTERLPKPYLSTVTTLRQATGWPLPEPAGATPIVTKDAGMVVHSSQSGDCDSAAHARQIQVVAPMLIHTYLAPRWAQSACEDPPDTERPAVAVDAPCGYRCAVAELCQDARVLGTLRLANSGYVPRAGDLLISARSGGDPLLGGPGHVEIVTVGGEGGDPTTVGGNEGNTWTSGVYRLGNPDYRAAIVCPDELRERVVEITLEEHSKLIREIPGPKHHARIQEYHAGARRGGGLLAGMPGHESEGVAVLGKNAPDEVPWCASGSSWVLYQALLV